MDEARVRALIHDMTILLKMYEVELTAYHQAYLMIENEAKKAGIPFNIPQALESLAAEPATSKEVDGMYAPLDALARLGTPDSLDSAVFAIQRIQTLRGVVKVNLPQTNPKGPIQ